MKADFNDTSATFAKYQLTVTLDVDSDDILYSSSNRVGVKVLQLVGIIMQFFTFEIQTKEDRGLSLPTT